MRSTRRIKLDKTLENVWDCPKCKAKVFVSEKIHALLCNEYITKPSMAEESHRIYRELKGVRNEKK